MSIFFIGIITLFLSGFVSMLFNKKFKTAYELPQLKAKLDIFNDLKDGFDFAIKNAEELDLDENSNPYTNMHKVLKRIL